MYTLASSFWKKSESPVTTRVFGVLKKMKMGKKWEDFSVLMCYTGSVKMKAEASAGGAAFLLRQESSQRMRYRRGAELFAPANKAALSYIPRPARLAGE